eukprot:TRINITY_DN4572_c0_g2_i2.p1 TRINITY_DN4572_c0_g2~~TRINITY_DN4572_c0_g2_i2.p1  ORF type:complete len:353 (-),score=78.79 TRINITY_DN4572_c0_g2_i2:59-1117(-)
MPEASELPAGSIQLDVTTVALLTTLRKNDESDDAVVVRALKALDTLTILQKALKSTETRKACIVTQQMRDAGWGPDMTTAICRALFGEQSDKEMKSAFKFFDKSKDGHLDKCELRSALPLMGEKVPDDKIDTLFKLVDSDGTGTIDVTEFGVLVRGMNPRGGDTAGSNPFAAFQDYTLPGAEAFSAMSAFGSYASEELTNAGSGAAAAMSAVSTAVGADIKGLNPMEIRKAGVILTNLREAGYSEAMSKQIVSAVLVDQSEHNIKKAFKFFDTDKSGLLDAAEIKSALPLMGEDVPPEFVDALYSKVDKNGDGSVCFKEFVVLLRGMNPKGEDASEATTQSGFSNFIGWSGK